MNSIQKTIHERTIDCANRFNATERELLDSLEEVERAQVYLALGRTSLFQYCIELLKLTESQAT